MAANPPHRSPALMTNMQLAGISRSATASPLNRSQHADFYPGTRAKAGSVPCVMPVSHQDGESVEVGEFHPQVLFSLRPAINLHRSVHSSPHFLIKRRNFSVCHPRSPLSVAAKAFPLLPERLLSGSHLGSGTNLLLSVGRVSAANESEICSYREKVSHARRLKKKKKKQLCLG